MKQDSCGHNVGMQSHINQLSIGMASFGRNTSEESQEKIWSKEIKSVCRDLES